MFDPPNLFKKYKCYKTLVKNKTHRVINIIPATNLIIFLLLTLLIARSPSLVLNADIQ